MEREIRRFTATSDSGEEFTVAEMQKLHEGSDLSGYKPPVGGLRWFELSDGLAVSYIDAETFQIFETQQIIRKVG